MKIILFGSTGTIGLAVQKALEEKNHEVIGISRKTGKYRADMQDIGSIRAAYELIGKVDAIACAAGEVFSGPLEQTTDEQWANSFRSKAMGQINVVRAGIPYVADHGSFTLISGILADDFIKNCTVSTTINHTVQGFVMAAAAELPRGIRINCISPTVLTESKKYHPYFPGFIPVDGEVVGQAYLRTISNPGTGRIVKIN